MSELLLLIVTQTNRVPPKTGFTITYFFNYKFSWEIYL